MRVSEIKNIFFSKVFRKRGLFLAVLSFAVFGALFPFFCADAQFGIFGGIADGIAKAISGIIAAYLLMIPTAIFSLAALILQWTISPGFINVPSYTSGSIVDVGWPIVRDLANMGIVMVLIIIGLGTALRLEEYQARRILPRLIFVALLINFSPVILGFIVDFTNIVMNFFLDGLMGIEGIFRYFSAIQTMVASDMGSINFFNPLQMIIFLIKIQAIGIFYTLAAIVFLLFAVLFVLRRIAIWMLVIMSPIAFVAWILDGTRPFWHWWWKNFVQWAIIGVFCAFFLYLGDHMIGLAATGKFTGDAPGGFGGWLSRPVLTLLEQLMPFVVAIMFLAGGFFVALSSSAVGSGVIISAAQKGTKAAGKRLGTIGLDRARTAARNIGHTYQLAERYRRRYGLSRAQAAGAIWQRRIRPALRPEEVGRTAARVLGGMLSATRDAADAGRRAALGQKRRGTRNCPACGRAGVAWSATACPGCGHTF